MKDRHRKLARERFWGEHDREKYSCPDCGRQEKQTTGFEIHHQSGNAHDNTLGNLVGLCRYCHCVREDRKPPKEAIEKMQKARHPKDHKTDLQRSTYARCPECGEKHHFCPMCGLEVEKQSYLENGRWAVHPNIPSNPEHLCAEWNRGSLYIYFHSDDACRRDPCD